MVECEICGAPVSGGSAFTCTYCGGTFCPAHRLPFNHACPRIEDWKHAKPVAKKRAVTPGSGALGKKKQDMIVFGVIALFIVIMLLWFFHII